MTQEIERESLAAHVDICAIRYENLEKRLHMLEENMAKLVDLVQESRNSMAKILVGTCGTIITGIISTVIVVLLK